MTRIAHVAVLGGLLLAGLAESAERPAEVLARLPIEGARTFDVDRIRSALAADLDVLWAVERGAPPDELSDVLRQKITEGYRHAGFPDARVEIVAGGEALNVREGRRFRSGRVRIEAAAPIPSEEVGRALTEPAPPRDATARFYEDGDNQSVRWFDAEGEEVELGEPMWKAGEWASFTERSRVQFERGIRAALSDAGFPAAEFRVRLERDEASTSADLVATIDDSGRRAAIERVEIAGNERNSREAILAYLEVPPGAVFTRAERIRIERLLWRSGRFARYDVALVRPEDEDEPFVLRISVTECADVSPIDQPPTREEQVLLKARDWLSRFEQEGYELVARAGAVECVFSPREGLVVILEGDPTDDRATLRQSALVHAGRLGLYHLENGRKLELSLPESQLNLNVDAVVADDSEHTGTYRFGGFLKSLSDDEPQPPARFTLRLAPALFMVGAHRGDWVWDDDRLVLRGNDVVLKIDPRTGQLSAESAASNATAWRVDFERGAFTKRKTQIRRAADDFDNEYDPRRFGSSIFGFLHEALADRQLPEKLRPAVAVCDLLGQLVDDGIFDRENATDADCPEADGEPFTIPGAPFEQTGYADLALAAYLHADAVLPPRSWAWTLWRCAAASGVGDERFQQAANKDLLQLLRTEDQGPLADLVINGALGSGSPISRYLAAHGLSRLDAADFQKDYGPLIDTRYLCGQLIGRAADILRSKDAEERDELLEAVPSPYGNATREVVAYLQRHPDTPTDELLPGALDRLWDSLLRERVEGALRRTTE